jgi:hypothetical protein
MWQNLKQSDVEQAKLELQQRREQLLVRHAEEIKGIEAERAEIDTLAQMIAAFAGKFKQNPN